MTGSDSRSLPAPIGLAVGVLALLAAPEAAGAQTPGAVERRERIDRARELDPRDPTEGTIIGDSVLDYGGWIRVSFLGFDVVDRGAVRRIERQDYDLRLWGTIRLWEAHTLYLRAQLLYTAFAHDDGLEDEEDVRRGPRVDLAFYRLDVAALVDAPPDRGWDLSLRGGRIYVQLGSGLVLNNILDGGLIDGRVGPARFSGFVLLTTDIDRDIDPSRLEREESDRLFAGGTIEASLPFDAELQLFAVHQQDRNREEVEVVGQAYEFDSEYYGAALRGRLPLLGTSWEAEYVHMRGRRYASLVEDERDPIEAHAVVAFARQDVPAPLRPRLEVGYLFGSGDDDRMRAPDTFLGNRAGTSDRTFTAFGFVPLGLALNPILANLHVAQAGVTFELPTAALGLGRAELTVDGFGYWKVRREGGISDPFANRVERSVGWALDALLNWQVLSDVTITGRFGVFFPGSAYADKTDRYFFGAAAVLQF